MKMNIVPITVSVTTLEQFSMSFWREAVVRAYQSDTTTIKYLEVIFDEFLERSCYDSTSA